MQNTSTYKVYEYTTVVLNYVRLSVGVYIQRIYIMPKNRKLKSILFKLKSGI